MKNTDIPAEVFMQSLLKSAKERGISLVAIYGYQEHGRAVMRMSSTENEAATKGALTWMYTKAGIKAENGADRPTGEETPTDN